MLYNLLEFPGQLSDLAVDFRSFPFLLRSALDELVGEIERRQNGDLACVDCRDVLTDLTHLPIHYLCQPV